MLDVLSTFWGRVRRSDRSAEFRRKMNSVHLNLDAIVVRPFSSVVVFCYRFFHLVTQNR